MAELVDALDSGSSRGNPVDVRVISAAKMFALVAGGEFEPALRKRLEHFDHVIAVDGGLRYLKKAPQAIIGDFDSVASGDLDRFQGVYRDIHPQDKDKSDTELAVEFALAQGAQKIVLFGALGGWADHALANLFLLKKYPEQLSIETECQTLYAICQYKKGISWPGMRLSLFPAGEKVEGVSTKGLKWELSEKTLDSNFFSLSNVALGSCFEVYVGSGTLICIVQNG